MIARRFIIRGRVQGVGYRFFAVRTARAVGVVGTVRNLPDGSVEVFVEGAPRAVAEFRGQLEQGPSYARVTGLDEIDMIPTRKFSSFDVSY
jgi:acylphosphatase